MRWSAPVKKRHTESWRMDQNGSTKVPRPSKTPLSSIPNLFLAVLCVCGVFAARTQRPQDPQILLRCQIPKSEFRRKSGQIWNMYNGSFKKQMQPIRDTHWAVRIHILDLLCGRFTPAGPPPWRFSEIREERPFEPNFCQKNAVLELEPPKKCVSVELDPPRY